MIQSCERVGVAGSDQFIASINTATVGVKTGQVTVANWTSAQLSDEVFGFRSTVYAHATPLLSSTNDDSSTDRVLTLDFGVVELTQSKTIAFTIANGVDVSRLKARLELDNVPSTGTGLSWDVNSFTGEESLESGNAFARSFSLTLNGAALQEGMFQRELLLGFSDQNLPGATASGSDVVVVRVVAQVVPEPSSVGPDHRRSWIGSAVWASSNDSRASEVCDDVTSQVKTPSSRTWYTSRLHCAGMAAPGRTHARSRCTSTFGTSRPEHRRDV
jgi:hypothetical protein